MPALRVRDHLATAWRRLNAPSRIAGVDLARGLAVIGMFAAHLVTTSEQWVWSDPATWSAVVDGRSSILFATLAGVSIGLVSGGARPLGAAAMGRARGRLALRAVMLLVLGILLILTGVPVYVILPAYALLFLLALPATRLRAGMVLALAGGLGLVMPFVQFWLNRLPIWASAYGPELDALIGWHYPFTLWIVFVLTGLGIARCDVRRATTQGVMLLAGAGLALIGYGMAQVPPPSRTAMWAFVWTAAPHSGGLWEVIGSGGLVVAVLGAALLLCRVPVLRLLTLPLRATGAMPLTAYTAQLVAWAIWAAIALGDPGDLFGFRALDPFWPLLIATVVGCTAWALLVGRGPLEQLLDRAARAIVPEPASAVDEQARPAGIRR